MAEEGSSGCGEEVEGVDEMKHRVVFEVDSTMLSAVLSANDHTKGVRLLECELIGNGKQQLHRHRVSGQRGADMLLNKMRLSNKPVTIEEGGELSRWWVKLGYTHKSMCARMSDLRKAGLVKSDARGRWALIESGKS